MLPVAEFALPELPPSRRESLGLLGQPMLQRVELAALQVELAEGRLEPAQFLGPAEQASLAGFTFAKRRLEWLGGRLAAKAAALAWTGQPLTTTGLAGWRVENAADGRPGLRRAGGSPDGPNLELSISHSQGLAGALVAERPCGLDLQKVNDAVVRVRERFCSEAEAGRLENGLAPGAGDELRLTLLWAAKEALRKGRGGVPLTGFLAMQLVGVEELAESGWCFRLAVAGAGEYPLLVLRAADYAWAVCVP